MPFLIPNPGVLGTFLDNLKGIQGQIDSQLTTLERSMGNSIQQLQGLITLANNAGTPGTSAFARHAAFAAQIRQSGTSTQLR